MALLSSSVLPSALIIGAVLAIFLPVANLVLPPSPLFVVTRLIRLITFSCSFAYDRG